MASATGLGLRCDSFSIRDLSSPAPYVNGATFSDSTLLLVVDIAFNLQLLHRKIDSVASACGRDPQEVQLLVVSKTFPPEAVEQACRAGQKLLGENRVQEAEQKIPAIKVPGLKWHLIGHLQANKAHRAVQIFDVIESLDSQKIARRVNRIAQELGKKMSVLLQVNIGEEPQKDGVIPRDVPRMVHLIDSMDNLKLLGLMTIPPYHEDAERTRLYFREMVELLDELNRRRKISLTELSMGMSHDYQIAIEEGATLLRIGTAIFGSR